MSLRALMVICLSVTGSLRAHAEAAPAPTTTFDIFEYRVLGNSTLPARDIERAVYPFLGEQRSFEQVQAAAAALEQAYRSAGYSTVFVDVPEQAVDAGVVRLRVTEARVGQRRVVGARSFSSREIAAAVPSLAPGEVPHFPSVQAQLATLNRIGPDLQVTPVLKSGAQPGTVDVDLKVKDELPLNLAVEVNDRYTADTTHTRASVTLGYDAMFGRPQSFSLQYQTAPEEPDEARVIAATYVARQPGSGRALAFYAVDSDSDVATVGALGVIGKGQIFGARYIVPLSMRVERSSSLTLGLDYKDFDETVLIDADDALVTPISYLTASLAYADSWSGSGWQAGGSISPRFGFRGVVNGDREFADKRYLARANFFYLAGDVNYRRTLPRDFGFALRGAWQLGIEPLVSNEQFAIGGMSSVRGYLEAEQLGDYGASGTLELLSPGLHGFLHENIDDARLLAFVDAGYAALHEPLPDQENEFELISAGVGLRLVAFDGLSLTLDWAYPLLDGGRTRSGDQRFVFAVRYSL